MDVIQRIEKDGETYDMVKPSFCYEASYRAYIAELGNEERYPFVLDLDASDFSAYLARVDEFERGVKLPAGYVESTTFWLTHNEALIGVANLRHRLNEEIKHIGGHIGLGIRPSFRGKGLSVLLLSLVLSEAKKRSVGEPCYAPNADSNAKPIGDARHIHVHCYDDNEASKAMIRAVDGVLHSYTHTHSGAERQIARFIVVQ